MGFQVLKSISHNSQEANLLIDGVRDGATVTNGRTQQTGVQRVNDTGFWDGGQNGITCRLVNADNFRFTEYLIVMQYYHYDSTVVQICVKEIDDGAYVAS